MISSEPAPQIIFSNLHLKFFEMANLKFSDLLSGYLEKLILLLISFLTLGLTPKADSFADNFTIF